MAVFERSVWIDRSPGEVFAFLTDPANAKKVSSSIESFEQVSSGPVGPGTRFREKRGSHTTHLVVGRHEPPTGETPGVHEVTTGALGVDVSYLYEFTAERGGTAVRLVCEAQARGVKKPIAFLLGKQLEKEDGDQLDRLRAAIEGAA